MNTKSLILEGMNYELIDFQAFLQVQYPDLCIDGLSIVPLADGRIELIIHSQIDIPKNLIQEISELALSFILPAKTPETTVLSNEELTDLVSVMFTKMTQENMIDNTTAVKYSKVFQNSVGFSKTTKN